MDAPAKLHPTDQTLSSYGLGKLDAASADVVNQHVESCPGCRNRVAALSSGSFLGRPRAAQAKDRSDSPAPPIASTAGLSMLASGDPSVPVPPSASSLPPGLADHPDYRILRELGQGGMGVVYLAENTLMGRKEVLKVVGSHLINRRGVLERFVGEIRSAARLHHPNVVTAYAVIRLGESLVLAMEYSLGCTLYYLLTAGPPFQGTSLYDILQAHHSRDALPLNLARPEVPIEVAAIVAKMMAKEPERRFQEPKQVAQALLPFFKKGSPESVRSKPEVSQAGQTTARWSVSTPTRAATDAGRSAARDEEMAKPPAKRSKNRGDLPPPEKASRAGQPPKPWFWSNHPVGTGCSEIFIPDPPNACESVGFRVARVPSEELNGTSPKALGPIKDPKGQMPTKRPPKERVGKKNRPRF